MVRIKLDNRIRTLIENGVAMGHRSMFAIVGDKGRDQVVILHNILINATIGQRPSVLWCYKKELGFSSHRKKRMKELQKKQRGGKFSVREDDPFDLFILSTQIRYCYYSETHKILGNTFGMLVLQDFEAITPNLLARTIETIEGGGLVVLLLRSVSSLRQLFTMTMDVHSRYRTESHTSIVPRFNERFILSLASCRDCVVVDDQLNVLPISSHIAKLERLPPNAKNEETTQETELKGLKSSMQDTQPIGALLNKCKTACQAKALLRLLDVITEKTLKATCSITAARGRGKSAALGLAIAGAIGFGYSNIFVTSPSPENLRTLFEFIAKGFDAMNYEEHTDYELIQSINPDFNKAVVRVNVFREESAKANVIHRQTVQYIQPNDAVKLGQAELVVIDEAAAIPLPLVKELMGLYLVFMASTINGYEGTGRSLSLKLLQQLREQAAGSVKNAAGQQRLAVATGVKLHEITLDESIRYKPGDQIEAWLNKILCLDATVVHRLATGTPPPCDCELFYVNRDTLFSFHRASETFLQRVMAIYVAAHYKNSPNDLQMLSDAPAHHLFVLMAPIGAEQERLPEVLAVVQVCIEGAIASKSISDSLEKGRRAAGDLIPWTLSQNFLDKEFPTLCGVRIVRIAVHPDYQSMGYGSRALELLSRYYEGAFPCLKDDDDKDGQAKTVRDADTLALLEEKITPRPDLPPLLQRLTERRAELVDYLGVSFGLTLNLLKFWKAAGFVPVYLHQTANDLTGEYSMIMLKLLHDNDEGDEAEQRENNSWLSIYWMEFRHRLLSLFAYEFSKFQAPMALSLLQLRASSKLKVERNRELTREELSILLSNGDLRRLSRYSRNMIDHQLITDLLPTIGRLYFDERLGRVKLSAIQSAVLLGFGLQLKRAPVLATELGLPQTQLLALFNKAIRQISLYFDEICMKSIEQQQSQTDEKMEEAGSKMQPTAVSLLDDLDEAAEEIEARQRRDREQLKRELRVDRNFSQFAIRADDDAFTAAMGGGDIQLQTVKAGGILSVKGDGKSREKRKKLTKEEQNLLDAPDPNAARKRKRKSFKDKYA